MFVHLVVYDLSTISTPFCECFIRHHMRWQYSVILARYFECFDFDWLAIHRNIGIRTFAQSLFWKTKHLIRRSCWEAVIISPMCWRFSNWVVNISFFEYKFEFISPAHYSVWPIWTDVTTNDVDSHQWDLYLNGTSAHNFPYKEVVFFSQSANSADNNHGAQCVRERLFHSVVAVVGTWNPLHEHDTNRKYLMKWCKAKNIMNKEKQTQWQRAMRSFCLSARIFFVLHFFSTQTKHGPKLKKL